MSPGEAAAEGNWWWVPLKQIKTLREESRIRGKSLVYSETKRFASHSADNSLLVNQRTLAGWLDTQKGAQNQNVSPLTMAKEITGGVLRRSAAVNRSPEGVRLRFGWTSHQNECPRGVFICCGATRRTCFGFGV